MAQCHFILSDQTAAMSASMLTSGSSSFLLVFLCVFRAVASHFCTPLSIKEADWFMESTKSEMLFIGGWQDV